MAAGVEIRGLDLFSSVSHDFPPREQSPNEQNCANLLAGASGWPIPRAESHRFDKADSALRAGQLLAALSQQPRVADDPGIPGLDNLPHLSLAKTFFFVFREIAAANPLRPPPCRLSAVPCAQARVFDGRENQPALLEGRRRMAPKRPFCRKASFAPALPSAFGADLTTPPTPGAVPPCGPVGNFVRGVDDIPRNSAPRARSERPEICATHEALSTKRRPATPPALWLSSQIARRSARRCIR